MFIRDTIWERVREVFSEEEKARLRTAVTGETICPRRHIDRRWGAAAGAAGEAQGCGARLDAGEDLMGATTKIEWTDATWNPIRGCSRVSEGCRHCYAERDAYRFSGPGRPFEGLAVLKNGHASWTGKIQFVEKHLLDPVKWREPRRIFVNSMSDLFHENVTDEMRDKIFAVMFTASRHIFQVLTKRPKAMREYFSADNPRYTARKIADAAAVMEIREHCFDCDIYFPLMNVWLGVSVENQAAADERIPLLLQTPAAVRFISAEPLLGPVDLERWSDSGLECECGWSGIEPQTVKVNLDDDSGFICPSCGELCAHLPLDERIDWVICGGESGPGARPMHPDWARSLRDQCQAAGVPFFFKQWGEMYPCNDGDGFKPIGKKAAGAVLDRREWKEFPGQ